MAVDLAQYRAENAGFYGQASLADVAADLHQRSGAAGSGLSFEDFSRQNGFDAQIARETQPQAPKVGGLPDMPKAGFWDDVKLAGKVVGQGLYSAVADVLPKTVAETMRGGDVPLRPEETRSGRIIAEQQQDLERWKLAPQEADRELFGVVKAKDVQEGLQNLGYSAGSMVAGGLAGSAAGSVIPGAGTVTGAVAGAVGAGLASGTVGYRATKDQFVEDIRKRMLQADPNLTDERWQEAKKAIESDASLYGLWEAVPEAVGSALTWGILKTPVGKLVESVPFIRNGAARAAASAGVKLGLDLPVELGTETWTQHEQGAIEAKQGLREAAPTWGEAFDEVAPQTTVATLATMGLGGAAEHFSPGARRERRTAAATGETARPGSVETLSDEDLQKTYAEADALFRARPSIELRDALLGLNAEQLRRRGEGRGFPLNEFLADDEAARAEAARQAEPLQEPDQSQPEAAAEPAQPDRTAALTKLSKSQLNTMAAGLGVDRPGRVKRDELVTAIMAAEDAARAWNEPEAVDRRYQEAHAAAFPGQQDDFLAGAAPAAEAPQPSGPEAMPESPAAVSPDRAAELTAKAKSELNTMAAGLGIARPGRLKRDDLVSAIVAAEDAARVWNEPEAVDRRYQEAHAAAFPGRQDDFLAGVAPVGDAAPAVAADKGGRKKAAETPPVPQQPNALGEIPLVAVGETAATADVAGQPENVAGQPAAPPTPAVLPNGEIPLREVGEQLAATVGEAAKRPGAGQEPVQSSRSPEAISGNSSAIPGNSPTIPGNSPTIPGNSPTIPGNAGRPVAQEKAQGAGAAAPQRSAFPAGDIADAVKARLVAGERFTSKQLFDDATKAYGGRMADKAFSAKDAYDAMELGVNRYIAEKGYTGQEADPKTVLAALSADVLDKLPTQTRRSAEQIEKQQFSTPPHLAYAAARLADIRPGETVLEPSGGIGGLATFAHNAGGQVFLNELDPRRLELARSLGFAGYSGENAEQLHNILPDTVKPSVVIMNPPFSSSSGRIEGKRDSSFVKPHLEQALKRLAPGGRLVAVVGDSMAPGRKAFDQWWRGIAKAYNVRANVGVDGREYRKYGTTYDVRLLVIDKTGPTAGPVLTENYKTVAEALDGLEAVRVSRGQVAAEQQAEQPAVAGRPGERAPGEQARPGPAAPGGRDAGPGIQPGLAGPDAMGPGQGRPGRAEGSRPGRLSGESDVPAGGRTSDRDAAAAGTPGSDLPGREVSGGQRSEGSGLAGPGSSGQPADSVDRGVRPSDELTVKAESHAGDGELTDSVFDAYRPNVSVKGAKAHPGPLAESAAMASVRPAAVSYTPRLPQALIDSGRVSAAQLEPIIYAGHAHAQTLPSGERRGYFIGDGTGVGKGREIAGILFDNWNQGRKKAVWISEKRELAGDARRDVAGIGWDSGVVVELAKIKAGEPLQAAEGVVFASYDTLKSQGKADQKSRLDQLVNWLGPDFDGVIAFDEAHNMGNAVEVKGKRGLLKPSQKALAGVELQKRLPQARVVYVSATGATEVKNLSYAGRLGLWGPETPFPDVQAFMAAMEAGGLPAMELVAANLKAMGLYGARSLSYDGVRYERLEHALTPDQRRMYDTMADAWQVVLRNIGEALDETGGAGSRQARSAAYAQFWGSHQRCFNQVLTAMMTPTVIKEMEADLSADRSIVVQLTNTGEAASERELGKLAQDGVDLEDLDITPREALMGFVERSFPVIQYEEVKDDNGNTYSRKVVDANGDPVFNRDALERRGELLAQLGSVKFPEAPLDQIISHFGPKNVAEVTGRGRRVVWADTPEGRSRVVQKRSKAMGQAEKAEFMAGKRRVLIFSEAGGTGQSYHADNEAENRQQRVQYLVQAGWRADKAVQGLGRTHRTNQASEPIYKLCTTDVVAQKRFLSTIARRLDQLGALTRGQRETGSQGIFAAKDNLENEYASQAVLQFTKDLFEGKIDGLSLAAFESQTGLSLTREFDGMIQLNPPSVPQFLNRLLSLRLASMNQVFDAFSERLDAIVDAANEAGTLDTGINTIRDATRVSIGREQVVHTDPSSGAQASYVRLDVEKPVPFRSFDELGGHVEAFVRNVRSGQVWAVDKRIRERTKIGEGSVEQYRTLVSPTSKRGVPAASLSAENYEPLSAGEARRLWEAEIAAAPKTRTEPTHLVTGALLPIWDRIPGDTPRIVRAMAEGGRKVLGREIPEGSLAQTLENLGVGLEKVQSGPAEIVERVMAGATAKLANGWRLKKSRVSSEDRLELVGPEFSHRLELRRQGLVEDVISHATRWFLPMDKAEATLAAITRTRPVVSLTGGKDAGRFRRADAPSFPSSPMTRAVAEELRQGLARLPAMRGLVDIYTSEAELSAGLRSDVAAAGVSGRFYGVYDPESGRIALVAANIPSVKAGQAAFVGALIRHEGRHAFFDRAFDGSAGREAYFNSAAQAMPRDVAAWLQRHGLESNRANRAEAAEEILAAWAKDGTTHRVLDRLLAKLVEWARAIFPNLKLSRAEMRVLLAQADDFVDGKGLDFFAPGGEGLTAAPAFSRGENRFSRVGDLTGAPAEKRELTPWLKDEATATMRTFLPSVREAAKETGWLGKILRSPEYWRQPVLKRLYEVFRDRTDRAHELLHDAFDLGDGKTIPGEAARILKDKQQRAILSEGVDYADVNEIEPEEMEKWFAEHGANAETVGLWRAMRAGYDKLLDARLESFTRLMDKARAGYERALVRRLEAAGVPAEAAREFDAKAYNADKTLPDELAPYADEVKAVVAAARKDGLTIKGRLADVKLTDEAGTTFSFAEMVERMGQLRGFYAPRLREAGEFVVRGERVGADGKKERFRAHKEWRKSAEKLRLDMARDGWTMEPVGKIEKLPEATQGVIKALELAKTVESAVNQAGEDVDAAVVRDILEQLADDVKARGFRSQSIRRSGRHGDVVQGYFKDALERYTRYAGSTAYGLAKADAARQAVGALFGADGSPGIDIRKDGDAYRLAVDYLAENLRNAESGDRVFSLAKSLASLKYLGLNPKSALVNLTSMATSVPAALHAYAMDGKGGYARIGREVVRAMADYLGVMTKKWGRLSADERAFMEQARRESLDDPQFARDALSVYRDTAGQAWTWAMGKAMTLFGATEQLNRGATLLAGYRLARAAGADHATAMERARQAMERAHGVYDRASQPAMTWGTGAGARLGQSWYVYKKYGHNYLQLIHELWANQGDRSAALFALAAPAVLGGVGGHVLMTMAKALMSAGGGDDPEKWVYAKLRDNLGGQAEDLARFGLLGLTGADVSGSMNMVDMPDSWGDILGPMGGLAKDVGQAIGYLAGGQPGRAAEKALPTGVAKVLQAVRESRQGVTTGKNYPVMGEDGKPLKPTLGESVGKAAGFRPLREARARDMTSEAINEERGYAERRDALYARYRAFSLDGGTDAGERDALIEEINAFNADAAGLPGRVAPITRESLTRQMDRLAQPTKRERARLGLAATKPAADALDIGDFADAGHPFQEVRRTYAATKERHDAMVKAGDYRGAAALSVETRLPLLRRMVNDVGKIHEDMHKTRESRLSPEGKARRLEILRGREKRAMDRAAAAFGANGQPEA